VPWTTGKLLAWDYTCSDSLAPSNVDTTLSSTTSVAAQAELRKNRKYEHLGQEYFFIPIASETLGGWGPQGSKFLSKLGKMLLLQSKNPREPEFLFQRLSMAIQRGNAISLLGGVKGGPILQELEDI
jgi:hypothetical protein